MTNIVCRGVYDFTAVIYIFLNPLGGFHGVMKNIL